MNEQVLSWIQQGGFLAVAAAGWSVSWIVWQDNRVLTAAKDELHKARVQDTKDMINAMHAHAALVEAAEKLLEEQRNSRRVR